MSNPEYSHWLLREAPTTPTHSHRLGNFKAPKSYDKTAQTLVFSSLNEPCPPVSPSHLLVLFYSLLWQRSRTWLHLNITQT